MWVGISQKTLRMGCLVSSWETISCGKSSIKSKCISIGSSDPKTLWSTVKRPFFSSLSFKITFLSAVGRFSFAISFSFPFFALEEVMSKELKDCFVAGEKGGDQRGHFFLNQNWGGLLCRKEKEMAAHSSVLAWRILWTQEPGRLQTMESQRVGHD